MKQAVINTDVLLGPPHKLVFKIVVDATAERETLASRILGLMNSHGLSYSVLFTSASILFVWVVF